MDDVAVFVYDCGSHVWYGQAFHVRGGLWILVTLGLLDHCGFRTPVAQGELETSS